MIVNELQAKSILSKSQVFPYTINAYTGCEHACSYCYARFMRRFSGHKEQWGAFVDVKVNAPQLLAKEIQRKPPARVWVSGVCDPYQPLEVQYRLTQQCLEILIDAHWPVSIQTKSPLVTRDIDILRADEGVEVGLSIGTADEHIRQIFEPHAPSIPSRIEALQALHAAGIHTFVMIAPILPGAEDLPELLAGNELPLCRLGLSQVWLGALPHRGVLRDRFRAAQEPAEAQHRRRDRRLSGVLFPADRSCKRLCVLG